MTYKPNKGCNGKRKIKNTNRPSNVSTRGKNACCTALEIIRRNIRYLWTTLKKMRANGLTNKTSKAADKIETRM